MEEEEEEEKGVADKGEVAVVEGEWRVGDGERSKEGRGGGGGRSKGRRSGGRERRGNE